MEDLPSPLVVDILSRLSDPVDVGRCRLVSRTINSLSYQVPSLSLLFLRRLQNPNPNPSQIQTKTSCSSSPCSSSFSSSSSFKSSSSSSPSSSSFKSCFVGAVFPLNSLRSLSLSVQIERKNCDDAVDEDVDDFDDLYLTARDFLIRWLPFVGRRGLNSLAISDYWVQSCWRKSDALSLISQYCGSLQDLMVKNAWLSVDGLRPMLKLTTLTLEFIRLDDENLDKMNECFPCLQVLNLIGVGGLKEPKIHLPQLRVCQWTLSNLPLNVTIHAPSLNELKLKCVEPRTLVLETPLLSKFDLRAKRVGGILAVGGFHNLESVRLESSHLRNLVELFISSKTVKSLELEVPGSVGSNKFFETITIKDLVNAFPNMENLKLGPEAWLNLGKSFCCSPECEWRNLKRLMVQLPLLEFDIAYISFMLNLCSPLCKVILLIHGEASAVARKHIISRCTSNFPQVSWQWGVWKKADDDKL